MDQNTFQIILAVISSGALVYFFQWLIPSLTIKRESEKVEIETEILAQGFLKDVLESHQEMLRDCAAREKEYLATIAEYRAKMDELGAQNQALILELKRSNNLIEDLKERLELQSINTSSMPYIDTIVTIFDAATKAGYTDILEVINRSATSRYPLRDRLVRRDGTEP